MELRASRVVYPAYDVPARVPVTHPAVLQYPRQPQIRYHGPACLIHPTK